MVYIIIVNYKVKEDCLDCIESISASDTKDYNIILVDNHSEDNSLHWLYNKLIQKHGTKEDEIKLLHESEKIDSHLGMKKVLLIESLSNRGFAGANNLVLKQLINKDGFVWLLNPDMVINPDTLRHLRDSAINNINKVLGSITINKISNSKQHLFGGSKIYPFFGIIRPTDKMEAEKFDYINGNSLFTHLQNIKRVGLLPEDYFLYWEETDWCINAKMKGLSLDICKKAKAFDKGATSIGRGFISDYYYSRNALIFLKKYHTLFHVFSATAFGLIRVVLRLISGNTNRAKGVLIGIIDFYKGKSGKLHA